MQQSASCEKARNIDCLEHCAQYYTRIDTYQVESIVVQQCKLLQVHSTGRPRGGRAGRNYTSTLVEQHACNAIMEEQIGHYEIP